METRELRYFVAVAEELHFRRAADRLRMSQPPLSRAIAQLERRLGVRLLDRGRRGVALTTAGEVLLADARDVLDRVDRAERRVREAGAGVQEVVLAARTGAKPLFVRSLLERYAAVPGRPPVRVVLSRSGEQARMVRDGRADVALLHPPLDGTDDLEREEFCVEGQVAVLPPGHPLAADGVVDLGRLAARAGVPVHGPSRPGADPDPSRAPGLQEDLAGLAQLVALGHAVAILPSSVAAQLPHDLPSVELPDAEPVTMAIAWAPSRSDGARDLLDAAREVRAAYVASREAPRLEAA